MLVFHDTYIWSYVKGKSLTLNGSHCLFFLTKECNVPCTDSTYQSYMEILDSDIDDEEASLAAAIEASLNDIQPPPEQR